MAWTTPRTWTTGELVTAAIMNTHARDNFDFLYAKHGVRLSKSAAQTLTTATVTDVTFDVEDFDSDGYHAGSGAGVTFPSGLDGLYLLLAECAYVANATGRRRAQLLKGSSRIGTKMIDAVGSGATWVQCATLKTFVAADTAKLQAEQTSGGNLDLSSGDTDTKLMAVWLGN